jgi:hypothetical protein
VYVAPVEGSGVTGSDTAATFELLRVAVSENEGFKAVDSADQGKIVLRSRLIRLGQSLVLSVGRFEDGKQVGETRRMKVSSIDDMDTVASRIVRAILSQRSVEDSQTVTSVTESEVQGGTRRFEGLRQRVLGFGLGSDLNLAATGMGNLFYLGYLMQLDFDFDLIFEYQGFFARSDNDAQMNIGGVGMSYYFNRDKHAPFVSGRIGYGVASADDERESFVPVSDDKASGFAYGVAVGLKFFRTSTVNMALEATFNGLFSKLDRTKKLPGAYGVRLLVAF